MDPHPTPSTLPPACSACSHNPLEVKEKQWAQKTEPKGSTTPSLATSAVLRRCPMVDTGRGSLHSPMCLNLQIFYSGEDMRSPETEEEEEEAMELTQPIPTSSQMAQRVEVDTKPHYFANQSLWPGTCRNGHIGPGNLFWALSPG